MKKKDSHGKHPGGVPNRQALQQKAMGKAKDAIEVLYEIMMNKDAQDSSRVSAAKTLLNKAIPDLKAMEMKDEKGNQIMPSYIVLGTIDENKSNPMANRSS